MQTLSYNDFKGGEFSKSSVSNCGQELQSWYINLLNKWSLHDHWSNVIDIIIDSFLRFSRWMEVYIMYLAQSKKN